MKALRLSPRAANDLEDISDYIARDDKIRALTFIEELREHCRRLPENPEAYLRRDELSHGIRVAVHGRYLILFRVRPQEVRIERIVHGARDLGNVFKSQLCNLPPPLFPPEPICA